MDAQNERLGWLNKHAPQILSSPVVSPQSRDQNVGKLRAINLKWSKVPTHPSYLAPLILCLPHSHTYSLQGDPRVAGQNQRVGNQPAESHPV